VSIGIAIAVPDGIALAADTQTTWNRSITTVKDKVGSEIELADPIQLPIGWSQQARKVFSVTLAGKTFAVVSAGEALLNSRSLFAVFRSGATKYAGSPPSCAEAAGHFKDHLRDELAAQFSCGVADLAAQPIKLCEFILAGYDDQDVANPFIESHLIWSGSPTVNGKQDPSGELVRWSNQNQANRCGGCWIGQTQFITHVVNHSNPDLPPLQGQYSMMTLADAVDYTRFLIAFVCDFQRFAVMIPSCGRPIMGATLTPEGYTEQLVP
jgi:hypothetical protein